MADVDFNQTWGWNPSNGKYEDIRYYPTYQDSIPVLKDGTTNDDIIFAEIINKLQFMILDVEKRTQYTAEGASLNSALYTKHFSLVASQLGILGKDRVFIYTNVSSNNSSFPFIFQGLSGIPFSSSFGVMCHATVYNNTYGDKRYRPVFSSVNVTGDYSVVISIVGLIPFVAGDVIEFTFSIMGS